MKNTILALTFISFFSCKDKIDAELKVKNDTLITKVINEKDKEDLEKNGFYAEMQYVIANKTYLRSQPDKNATASDTLEFGDKVFLKSIWYDEEGGDVVGDENMIENEKKNGFVAVYKSKPKKLTDKPSGYLLESVLTYEYEFESYKKNFSLPVFKKLDSNVKKAILDNQYLNGDSFELTQNAQKAPEAIATGDFDGDGLKDFAFALDDVEEQTSMILILLNNAATKEPYVGFKTAYQEYLKVKTIAKNTPLNSTDLETGEPHDHQSDLEVVQIFGKSTNGYLVYDKDTNKFVQK